MVHVHHHIAHPDTSRSVVRQWERGGETEEAFCTKYRIRPERWVAPDPRRRCQVSVGLLQTFLACHHKTHKNKSAKYGSSGLTVEQSGQRRSLPARNTIRSKKKQPDIGLCYSTHIIILEKPCDLQYRCVTTTEKRARAGIQIKTTCFC